MAWPGLYSQRRGEERTNANPNLKGKAAARDGGAWAGSASLVVNHRSCSEAGRYSRRKKRSTLRDRVLLQNQMGPCRRIPGALQEEPLPGSEKRDRAGPY